MVLEVVHINCPGTEYTNIVNYLHANQKSLKTSSTPPLFPRHCNVKDEGKSFVQANFGSSDLSLSQFL